MGIRAGMPGNGTDQRMWMRFTAEYWSRARQAWTAVSGTGVSPWVYAGSARLERRQAGWTFAFSEPPEGVTFTMRAQVEFEWRAKDAPTSKRQKRGTGRRVVHSEMRLTETGVRGVHGGDPAGDIEGDVRHLFSEQAAANARLALPPQVPAKETCPDV
jgi:hypothetical protein